MPNLPSKLRRIALDRQGLLKPNSFGRGKQGTLKAIERLGYIQIDTISVVERAHHHVLWSRLGTYQPEFLDELVSERKVFEYWSHAAAWLPMQEFRFALPRMKRVNGEHAWMQPSDRKLIRAILRRIEKEGPLRARDFEDTRTKKSGWWDWKPTKRALEELFLNGELMVSRREGFQKVYDLPERVLPDWVDTNMPDQDEYARHLIDATLRAHGFATTGSMTYLRKGKSLRSSVRAQLAGRVDAGELIEVSMESGVAAFIAPEVLESRTPRSHNQVRILSPFDNAVIQRQRGRDVFGFDYQIECYVPEAKRQYGYFCLPILYRDRLVGRVDCKAHRAKRQFEVKSLHIEHEVDDAFRDSLASSMRAFAKFNHCDEIYCRERKAKFLAC